MPSGNSLVPRREPVEPDAEAESVALDDAGAVIDALASDTARSVLAGLYEEARPAADPLCVFVGERGDRAVSAPILKTVGLRG